MVRAGRDLVSHDATVREAGGVDVPWVDTKLVLKPLEQAEHEASVCTTPGTPLESGHPGAGHNQAVHSGMGTDWEIGVQSERCGQEVEEEKECRSTAARADVCARSAQEQSRQSAPSAQEAASQAEAQSQSGYSSQRWQPLSAMQLVWQV